MYCLDNDEFLTNLCLKTKKKKLNYLQVLFWRWLLNCEDAVWSVWVLQADNSCFSLRDKKKEKKKFRFPQQDLFQIIPHEYGRHIPLDPPNTVELWDRRRPFTLGSCERFCGRAGLSRWKVSVHVPALGFGTRGSRGPASHSGACGGCFTLTSRSCTATAPHWQIPPAVKTVGLFH